MHHGLIDRNGIYDQNDGLLPVSGTPNVYGIVKYLFSWSLNGGNISNTIEVPDLKGQSICKGFDLRDGHTYTLSIEATDIAGHTYSENRTVHIDRSVPHINNIWLNKNGHKMLYVHNSIDLTKMELTFDALDPHSGLKNVEWTFGFSDSGRELAHEFLAVGTIHEDGCQTNISKCYCPDVGKCEIFNYTIPLNKLIKDNVNTGNHNRNYYFTVKATNHAFLSNIEHVDILVDDSPPEPGVVMEGPEDGNDIDYTSEDTVLVHWKGFIDHESGIKMYRVGIAPYCLNKELLMNKATSNTQFLFDEVRFTETSTRIVANFTGKMFTTVIALNNAMEPSKAVCSDGITRDKTPPELRCITLEHGQWSESVICHRGSPWLMHASLAKIRLHQTAKCKSLCSNNSEIHPIADILPINELEQNDTDISDFICTNFSKYTLKNIIYIPNDHISLRWNLIETDSQIQDYFVGFGDDPSAAKSPNYVSYVSTGKKLYFERRHEGIGSGTLFYIFIKGINKAGLEHVTTFGPVLIDETPPLFNTVSDVAMTDSDVVLGWENDTFYDLEQPSQINQIFFTIEHDGDAVTPMLEWRLDSSKPCPGFTGGCFKYSIDNLQRQDTDSGLVFYIRVSIYNNAGHFTEINSNPFMLPSKYPPGEAIVYDVDPEFKDTNVNPLTADIDEHFTSNSLCVRWQGFKHHKTITLELGVGSNVLNDDIIAFYPINSSDSACVESDRIKPGITHYALIRSTCSGGQTLSSSNGVTIWNDDFFKAHLNVKVGEKCRDNPFANYIKIALINGTNKFYLNVTFEVGQLYNIYFLNTTDVTISCYSDDALVRKSVDNAGSFYEVTPYVQHPTIVLASTANIAAEFTITKCLDSNVLQISRNILVSWYFNVRTLPKVSYEVAIEHNALANLSNGISYITPYFETHSYNLFTFRNTKLELNAEYRIAIRPCTRLYCLNSTMSAPFRLESTTKGNITAAKMSTVRRKDCYNLELKWSNFNFESGVTFYKWSISKDELALHLLSDWKTIRDTNNPAVYHVSKCVKLPVYPYATLYACVRAYSKAGNSTTVCKEMETNTAGRLDKNIVYDLDASTEYWENLLKYVHSSNIGKAYKELHDVEIDFVNHSAIMAGAILFASEREVTWYLMTSPEVPNSCDDTSNCITSLMTKTGFVKFDKELLLSEIFYYICAYSNSTFAERETFTERFGQISSCSDGFIVDDISPYAGQVTISNDNGYLNDLSSIAVSWSNFDDNLDAKKLGYINNMKGYSFALGSRPKGDDIMHYTAVGLVTRITKSDLKIADGSIIYCTVKATDHVGYTTSVSSEGVIVDTSPPLTGQITFTFKQEFSVFSSEALSFHLIGFTDGDSGVDHFEIGIGSRHDIANVVPFVPYYNEYVELDLRKEKLPDGHTYFVIVQAVNRAGLSSEITSASFVIDVTPPSGGHVLDGPWYHSKDDDYQSDIHHIRGHWKGFTDPHSEIAFYRVGLGSRPYRDDVEAFIDVGLRTVIAWSSSFIPGHKYYICVHACNGAGLCTIRASDGIILDNSPPIKGLVRVGSERNRCQYQTQNSSIRIQWNGFEDPQSSIDHFEACLGSKPDLCDIKPYFNCLLQSSTIKTQLNLPSNVKLYASVRVFNKIGMHVSQTSDAFIIDNTAPNSITRPTFLRINNAIPGRMIQWERSVIQIFWEFVDVDSPIVKHIVTLLTHHEGHTPVEYLELGNTNTVTINLDGNNWLNNGDTYVVAVTCCNAAGLCTTENSQTLMIDSSPPHIGGFKPPMTWNNFIDENGKSKSLIFLEWYGFADPESGIENFYITTSRNYYDDELTNGTVTHYVNVTSNEHKQDIELNEFINEDDLLILSIWAQNSAGLNSTIAKVTVFALSKESSQINISLQKGLLELEKHSCDVHFCNKDCTCAVLGKPCVSEHFNQSCKQINDNSQTSNISYPIIDVHGGLPGHTVNITASSACLSGHWVLISPASYELILRYEWSMGIVNQPPGEGIFDLQSERPWHDVGRGNVAVYCLPLNRSLVHNENYIIYVRAWYSIDAYAQFTSSPIKIDQTPPSVRRGKYVKDTDITCTTDYDIIDWMDTITACWTSVFSEPQGMIDYFTVALGTSVKADDIYMTANVGLNTSITLTNMSFTHGTRYYFTVTAYNNLGLHTATTSDGFVIDMDNPVAGVTFNTDRHRDDSFQSSNTSFSLSWHGFIDNFSGIKSYHVAVVEEHELNVSDITYVDVGIRSRVTLNNLSLEHGSRYIGLVKAYDGAGHVSTISMSHGKTIDVSPPNGHSCNKFIIVENQTESFSTEDDMTIKIPYMHKSNYMYKLHGHLTSNDVTAQPKIRIGGMYKVLPTILNHDAVRAFEYYYLSSFTQQHNVTIEFNAHLNTSVTVHLSRCADQAEETDDAVIVKQIALSTVAVHAMVSDEESQLYKVDIGAGSTSGGFQVRPLSPIYHGYSGILHVDVPHGTPVYITAIAENYAGLRSIFHSKPITMDHTSPTIEDVTITYDILHNKGTANDTYTALKEIMFSTTWNVEDTESGVQYCFCSIGRKIKSEDVQPIWLSQTNNSCTSDNVSLPHGTTVYVTVKCVNNIQMSNQTYASSIIATEQTKTNNAMIKFVNPDVESSQLTASLAQERNVSRQHIYIQSNNTCLQFEWSNFDDNAGVARYEYRLLREDVMVVDWSSTRKHAMTTLCGLHLVSDNIYTAQVRVVNSGKFVSDNVDGDVLICSDEPKLSGSPLQISEQDGMLYLDWSGVFVLNIKVPSTYRVYIGSSVGTNDVLEVQDTQEQNYKLKQPKSTMAVEKLDEIFVMITCTYASGKSTSYRTSYKR